MTAPDSLPLHALAEDNLAAASPDLLRAMVKTFADALMSAEADALCNAEYGQVSEDRVNHRNGYRPREWDTKAGTVELAVPKLRQVTSLTGYSSDAAGPNTPSSRWSPPPTCSA
jgi:transposase-like protein